VAEQEEMARALEEDMIKMIIVSVLDHKPSLYWYFTRVDKEKRGVVSIDEWATGLKTVLQLDLPFSRYLGFSKNRREIVSYDRQQQRTLSYDSWHRNGPTWLPLKKRISLRALTCLPVYPACRYLMCWFLCGSLVRRIADLEADGRLNYTRFLDRYRIEMTGTNAHWQVGPVPWPLHAGDGIGLGGLRPLRGGGHCDAGGG
jgi:hypothetical protein